MLFQFVFQQPAIFQANYVETFIGDTYHAYDGTENTISCVNGITERMLLYIGDACMMYCTMFKKNTGENRNLPPRKKMTEIRTRPEKTGQQKNRYQRRKSISL